MKSSLMKQFPPSIFSRLKEAAKHYEGEVIDLSLGSPDIPPASFIRETLSEASKRPDSYGYTMTGIPAFQRAVAHYYEKTQGVSLQPETEVLQTMGSQEGLVHLPLAFCEEGDIVLTTNPAYVAYDTGIHLAKAVPYALPLKEDNHFLPDLDAVPEEIAKKAKLLILNLPGNPVPATPTKAFFERVVRFAKTYNILVLHDAAYSEFYYDGVRPPSFLSVKGAKECGLETNSLSKSFSLAGARIAYFVGNDAMIQTLKELKSNLDYGVFQPIQEAATQALLRSEEVTEPLRDIFAARHRLLSEGLRRLGWYVTPSQTGMFLWVRPPYEGTSEDIAFRLIKQTGVVTVPGTSFGSEGEGYLRIALVAPLNELKEVLRRLQNHEEESNV